MMSYQNPMMMLNELRQNPSGVLSRIGYRVPTEMNDPSQILNYLMSSGQINGGRLSAIQNIAQMALKRP